MYPNASERQQKLCIWGQDGRWSYEWYGWKILSPRIAVRKKNYLPRRSCPRVWPTRSGEQSYTRSWSFPCQQDRIANRWFRRTTPSPRWRCYSAGVHAYHKYRLHVVAPPSFHLLNGICSRRVWRVRGPLGGISSQKFSGIYVSRVTVTHPVALLNRVYGLEDSEIGFKLNRAIN